MYDLEPWLADPHRREALKEAVGRGASFGLRDAKIKITSRCNLRCRMCDYWKTEDEAALDTDAWKRVLGELVAEGCRKVHFSGGEPFLRRDLVEILAHGADLGLKINVTTNGTLVTREAARRLVDASVNAVSVSLDGPTAALHDAIRGIDGSFKRSLRTLRRLRRFGRGRDKPLRLRINVVLMRDNYRRAAEMVALGSRLEVDDVVLMPVDESDPGPGPPIGQAPRGASGGRRLSRRQIARYNAEIAPEVAALRRRFGMPDRLDRVYPFGLGEGDERYAKRGLYARGHYEHSLCFAPWLHTFIAWDGSVYLCCMTTERMAPLGNVGQTPLADILRGERYAAVRASFLAGDPHFMCHRCDLFAAENRWLARTLDVTPAPRRKVRLPLRPPTGV